MPRAKEMFVEGWTGMRGVVALAAALSVPESLANGQPFPSRNLIIFLTFIVILVTLVLQGLTLPTLIRSLRLTGEMGPDNEEREARQLMLEAALAHIAKSREQDKPEFAGMYDNLAEHHQNRLADLMSHDPMTTNGGQYARYQELSFDLLKIERETVVDLRDQGRISDSVLKKLQRELDLNETRLSEK